MSRVRLTDVSEHQGRPSFRRLKDEDNIVGAGVKMTEGWGFEDPDGLHNLERIVANNLVALPYHFLWNGPEGRGGAHQAEFFLRQIRKVVDPLRVIPCVDVELSSNMEPRHHPRFADVRAFLRRLEDLLPGKRLGIYVGYYWREDNHLGNPRVEALGLKLRPIIWDAHYFHSGDAPPASFGEYRSRIPSDYWDGNAFGGMKADILQFSDKVRFSEYVGDADLADTDLATLRDWAWAA